ncbi:hypothetical protein ABZ353_10850 [Streptomyces niveus]|uniref:hypothetical protein n=1 Tax=Streptomyces niveus TaxID=193462 RepID=UPI0033E09743
MFEIGDKVITETDDELNGLPGVITGFSPHTPLAVHVLLDEDADEKFDYSMFFYNTELRKVEA